MQKAFGTIGMAAGVFLLTVLLAAGWSPAARKAVIDYSAKSFLSDEDREVLKDPAAANKTAYEKMAREAWQRTPSPLPQNGWDRGWKK
jgi:hypothetical protein